MKCGLSSDWALCGCSCCVHAKVEAVLLGAWHCLQIGMPLNLLKERRSAEQHKKESASATQKVYALAQSQSQILSPPMQLQH